MVSDLDYCSKRLGISRSAFLASVAAPALSDVRSLLEEMPGLPENLDELRYRGESVALVRMRMENLQQALAGDLVSPGVKGRGHA
jgi:hypothetical protein